MALTQTAPMGWYDYNYMHTYVADGNDETYTYVC